jgi:UDP-glucuronate decarboxylase
MKANEIFAEDLKYIYENLTERGRLKDSIVFITGCGGFLGYTILGFLLIHARALGLTKVIGIDNFKVGRPLWIKDFETDHKKYFDFYEVDLVSQDLSKIPDINRVTHVLHMASIASPTYYRKYPIETIESNVWGLKKLLDFFCSNNLKGFLFFSSSEIYGNPAADQIPTPETYHGDVPTIGPRACYDEAKRLGETLSYCYSLIHGMPVTIVRPFNNYGPGMQMGDGRLPPDLARSVIENRDMIVYSDGTPKRTFCYVADAVVGYFKSLLHGSFGFFNIGIDRPEISVRKLTEIFLLNGRKLFDYKGQVVFVSPEEKEFLRDNPQRRCPDISKAKSQLGYDPQIDIEDGVIRFLKFLKLSEGGI